MATPIGTTALFAAGACVFERKVCGRSVRECRFVCVIARTVIECRA